TLDPAWASPSIAMPPGDARELTAIADALAAEHARPFDEIQPWLLAALLRTLMLHAERLVTARHRASPVPAPLQRFLTILERDHQATRSVAHHARAAGL